MADELDISKNLEQSLRDSKKIQGDTNLELNKTINLLSKINDLRESSIAKVKSLNKETINTKDIQKELTKAKEKEELSRAKFVKLESSLSDTQKQNARDYLDSLKERQKKESEIQRAKLKGDTALVASLGVQLTAIDDIITEHEKYRTVEERRLASAIKSNDIAKETVGILQEELTTENDINKSIGISGKTMGFFAQKLGIGKQYYADMVEKARDLNEQGKKFTIGDKLSSLAKAAGGGIKEALTDPLTLIPMIGGAIAGLAKGLKSAFDYIVGIQDKTVKFGRAMNMSTEQARQLKMQYADISIANGDLFVNAQKLVEAQMDMVSALGVTNRLSTENLATNIKLKDIAGIEAETIASISEASIINGKSNESIVKSVFAQVKGLKQATGIQFENKQILKEASSLGGVLGLQFAKYPAQLTKSLVTVKAMGLELKQLDAMADSFLDFESSISKEFEAQLLTGKDINLAKARELFLDNDLAGAAAEINKQVGSTADFMKMNRIQQEALAGAMGMSRDQMGDMLKKQEMLSKLGAKDTDNAREQLKLGLEKYKNQQALSEAIGEENYQNLVNASLQEKIGAFMEKIKDSISNFVEKSGIIGKLEKMMDWLSKPENIRSAMMYVRDVFASIIGAMGKVAAVVMKGANIFGAGIDESMIEGAMNAGNSIRSMGGDLSMAAAKDKVGTTSNTGTTAAEPSTKMGRSSGGDTITNNLILDGQIVTSTTNKINGRNPHVDERTGK